MNADNNFYGHKAILARYVGFETEVPPIWGYLQHGFNLGTGFPAHYTLLRWLPKFVWSSRNLGNAEAEGVGRVRAIGAPFLYLDRLVGTPPPASAGTIAYPYHSWEKVRLREAAHDRYATVLREREHGPITVSLYFTDFADPAVRRVYEASGCRVVSHGTRYDPEFLLRQHRELAAHRRVVTNRVGTALLYGAALGREVEVYGPVFTAISNDEATSYDAMQRAAWPAFFADDPAGWATAADFELGREHVRAPDELAHLLGWRGPRRWLAPITNAAVRARRRVRSLDDVPGAVGLPRDLTAAGDRH